MVRVKKAKLVTIPKVIPNGLDFPPAVVDERTIGKSGQMQGARIVTNPEINAKNKSANIM